MMLLPSSSTKIAWITVGARPLQMAIIGRSVAQDHVARRARQFFALVLGSYVSLEISE